MADDLDMEFQKLLSQATRLPGPDERIDTRYKQDCAMDPSSSTPSCRSEYRLKTKGPNSSISKFQETGPEGQELYSEEGYVDRSTGRATEIVRTPGRVSLTAQGPDGSTVAAVRTTGPSNSVRSGPDTYAGDDIAEENRVLELSNGALTKEELLRQVYAAHQKWISMKIGANPDNTEKVLNFNLAVALKQFLDKEAARGVPCDPTLLEDTKFRALLSKLKCAGIPLVEENEEYLAHKIGQHMGMDPETAMYLAHKAIMNPEISEPIMTTCQYHEVLKSIPVELLDRHSVEIGLRGPGSRNSRTNIMSKSSMNAGQGVFPVPGKPLGETLLGIYGLMPVKSEHLRSGPARVIFQE